jgi:hypothetical protein
MGPDDQVRLLRRTCALGHATGIAEDVIIARKPSNGPAVNLDRAHPISTKLAPQAINRALATPSNPSSKPRHGWDLVHQYDSRIEL